MLRKKRHNIDITKSAIKTWQKNYQKLRQVTSSGDAASAISQWQCGTGKLHRKTAGEKKTLTQIKRTWSHLVWLRSGGVRRWWDRQVHPTIQTTCVCVPKGKCCTFWGGNHCRLRGGRPTWGWCFWKALVRTGATRHGRWTAICPEVSNGRRAAGCKHRVLFGSVFIWLVYSFVIDTWVSVRGMVKSSWK